MVSEIYLASVISVVEEHFMERAYLDELAKQLKLDQGLKEEIGEASQAVLNPANRNRRISRRFYLWLLATGYWLLATGLTGLR